MYGCVDGMCWCVDGLMYSWCVNGLMCWCVDVLMAWCVDVLMSTIHRSSSSGSICSRRHWRNNKPAVLWRNRGKCTPWLSASILEPEQRRQPQPSSSLARRVHRLPTVVRELALPATPGHETEAKVHQWRSRWTRPSYIWRHNTSSCHGNESSRHGSGDTSSGREKSWAETGNVKEAVALCWPWPSKRVYEDLWRDFRGSSWWRWLVWTGRTGFHLLSAEKEKERLYSVTWPDL